MPVTLQTKSMSSYRKLRLMLLQKAVNKVLNYGLFCWFLIVILVRLLTGKQLKYMSDCWTNVRPFRAADYMFMEIVVEGKNGFWARLSQH